MTTYRRRKESDKKRESDTWHWCKNCSNWPTYDYEEVALPDGERPRPGELDNECKAKEDADECEK